MIHNKGDYLVLYKNGHLCKTLYTNQAYLVQIWYFQLSKNMRRNLSSLGQKARESVRKLKNK